jgi:hypothetical protein
MDFKYTLVMPADFKRASRILDSPAGRPIKAFGSDILFLRMFYISLLVRGDTVGVIGISGQALLYSYSQQETPDSI